MEALGYCEMIGHRMKVWVDVETVFLLGMVPTRLVVTNTYDIRSLEVGLWETWGWCIWAAFWSWDEWYEPRLLTLLE